MNHKEAFDLFLMDRKKMLFYFTKANEILAEMERQLSIWVSGGANMCFYIQSRETTQGIDTYPDDEKTLRELSQKMQKLFLLPSAWLNPSGRIFITDTMRYESELGLNFNHLKVYFLQPEAMLVLKVLAGRAGEEFHDMDDTVALLKHLNIKSLNTVDTLVMKYKEDWNTPLVMNFANNALIQCWGDKMEAVDDEHASPSLEKYLMLMKQK
ncbi:MAG: hypothetical protein FWC16_09055 [Defluviitaleaceae bacterium]|nr:hypothetical protein [Defluviitaleaceae bacterium]MCL2275058.1 hypothetical protein [Defluviitaleaceae bacterium]